MPNEDNSQQPTNSNSQLISQLIAAVRSLEDRVIGLEPRLASVEEIIVARLNDTRPIEQQVLARLNELAATIERFRGETDENFRRMIERQNLLNEDNLTIRADHRYLEKRISRLEETRA